MDIEASTDSRFDLWWLPATAGLVLAAGGIALILWPEISVRVAATAIGLILTVSAFVLAISALVMLKVGYEWAVFALEALWAFALGLPLLLIPDTSVRALALMLGVLLVLGGAIKMLSAATLTAYLARPGRYLLRGFVAAVLGALLILLPGASITFVAIVIGAWMVTAGGLLLLSSLAMAGYR